MLGPGGLGGAAFKMGATQVIGLFGRMRLAAIGFNLSTLANPVVLIGAAAVAAVVGVGVGLVVRKYWEPIKAFFGAVGQGLGKAFGPRCPPSARCSPRSSLYGTASRMASARWPGGSAAC